MNPPQDFRPSLSVAATLVLHRYRITGLLCQFYRDHFHDQASFTNALLRDLIWQGDTSGGLAIEAVGAYKPAELPKRPSILIKGGDWRIEQIGLGNRREGNTPADGSTHYEMRVDGTHVVRALMPGSDIAADVLAAEILDHTAGFSDLIRGEYGFHRFQPAGLSAPQQFKEAEELWAVDLTLSYSLPLSWSTTMSAPPLKTVSIIPHPGS